VGIFVSNKNAIKLAPHFTCRTLKRWELRDKAAKERDPETGQFGYNAFSYFSPAEKIKALSLYGTPGFIPESVSSSMQEPFQDRDADARAYTAAPAWARKRADKYLAIITACQGTEGKKNVKAFVEIWNKSNPSWKTSYSAIRDARIRYEAEGVAGLFARYGKRAGVSIVPDILYEEFKRLWLSENKPSAAACWMQVLGFAKEKGFDVSKFPSVAAFMKRINREIPKSAQYLARHGQKKWNRKFASYVERDNSNVHEGEVRVSDHHQIDVSSFDQDTGKSRFIWLTVWRDYKSGKWLSWLLHFDDPNSDHIFYTFYISCLKYGLPKEILIDNGRDYRCKDFAGGRARFAKVQGNEDDQKRQTALSLLGVSVHFAAPYNAQAKPIERDFRSLINMFCKFCVGYRGSNITQRPEKLIEEIKGGSILSFGEFESLFNTFIEESFNNRTSRGKNHNGKSPNQLWAEGFTTKREISRDALALFCMRTSNTVKIGRNGVMDSKFGVLYWSEFMSGMKGIPVYLRRDPADYATAWVFHGESDEFLGLAQAGALTASAFAKTPVEKEQLRRALALKKRDLRIAKAYAKTGAPVSLAEHVSRMKLATQETSGGSEEASPKIHTISNSAFDKIARQKKVIDETGTADLSYFVPSKRREERAPLLSETEKEIWLRDPRNREIWNREHCPEDQLPILESDKREQRQAG
jgi:putative transposase